jgi:hypothetical protein
LPRYTRNEEKQKGDKKLILFLHYYKSIVDGVMTSMIDSYLNVRNHSDQNVQMNIICPELYLLEMEDYYNIDLDRTQWHEYVDDIGIETKPYDGEYDSIDYHIKCFHNRLTSSIPFLKYNRNLGDFNLLFGIKLDEKKFKADTIVCSARLIYELLMGADIELDCNKLIVLDSLDTYKSKVGIFPDMDLYFDTLSCDIVQLSNPSTFRETKYKQIEYYHKFNEKRLSSIRQTGRLKIQYIFSRKSKPKTKIDIFGYFENIGKGIFENTYFGIPVLYQKEGMFTKDGLWYYLNKFGLDATEDQEIKLKKSEIRRHLFFDRKDVMLNEII